MGGQNMILKKLKKEIKELKEAIEKEKASLITIRGGAAIVENQNIISLFLDECKKSPLWKRDSTFLKMVLNTLNIAGIDEDEWYVFRYAFSMNGRSLNCMTPVRQLIYTKYLALAEKRREAKKVSETLPLISLNQYMTSKKIGIPDEEEAIEIQAAMANLLLSNSEIRKKHKNCQQLPLSGYNAFDPKMITQHEKFGYNQLTKNAHEPLEKLVNAKLIFQVNSSLPIESDDDNNLFQINHSVLQYAIATGVGVDEDLKTTEDIHQILIRIDTQYKDDNKDLCYRAREGSYLTITKFKDAHILALIKYSRLFLADIKVIESVVESIICDIELISENLDCINQRGILSSESILQRLHSEIADKLGTEIELSDIKTMPLHYQALWPQKVTMEYATYQKLKDRIPKHLTHTVTIPDNIIEIDENAFRELKGLKRIKLPESIQTIGKRAFYGCENLTHINIPDSVESISDYAFKFCDKLKITIGYKTYQRLKSSIPKKLIHEIIFSGDIKVIEDEAFEGCCNIEELTIPKTVNRIGEGAFSGCKKLKIINIPENVTSISKSVFEDCESLETIILHPNVKSIGDCAFRSCHSLTSIKIPSGVTSIGREVFYQCKELGTIDIPDTVTSIGENAFLGCRKLKSINIPKNLTSIGDYAFNCCDKLESMIIPDSVTSIGDNAFNNCDKLKITIGYKTYQRLKKNIPRNRIHKVIISKEVDEIKSCEFRYHKSLESIDLPENIKSIGWSAFEQCQSLKTITLPDNLKTIGDYAFENCTELKSINIPDSVKSIGSDTFKGCVNLKITIGYKTYQRLKNNIPKELIHTIIISEDTVSIEKEAFEGLSGLESIVVPNSVKSIGEHAFAGCASIKSITLPNTINSIGEGAFSGCENLEKINISDNVTTINKRMFAGCKSLNTIILPPNVEIIGDEAFGWCDSLISIIIPKGVTSIGQSAFSGCEKLETINILGTVTSIGKRAFSGCKSLKNIILPDGVLSIGDYAFSGCKNLESITIPDSVNSVCSDAFNNCGNLKITIGYNTYKKSNCFIPGKLLHKVIISSDVEKIEDRAFVRENYLESIVIQHGVKSIGDYAFMQCSNLKSINIPDSVKTIGKFAFQTCKNIKDVTIGAGVKSIGERAFSGCVGLENISLGDGIESIGKYAFSGCERLTKISLADGIQSIGDGAFYGCASLKSINIPDSVESIGQRAFDNCRHLSITISKSAYDRLKSSIPQSRNITVAFNNTNDLKDQVDNTVTKNTNRHSCNEYFLFANTKRKDNKQMSVDASPVSKNNCNS